MLSAVSARVRVLIVALVLCVVAGGGWLIRVTADGSGDGGEDYAYRGPQPAAQQTAVTPQERREQTRDRAKPTKPHGLPTTRSKPATAEQIALLKQNQRNLESAGPKAEPTPAGSGSSVRQASFVSTADAAAASYTSGALYQVTADPFGNTAAQQGGWLMALGNYIGAAVPGEPLQVSAAIWQTGGADDEVHPVKVSWKVDYYGCRLSQEDNQYFDFGQTVDAPTLNTDKVFPVATASFTVPTTECTQDLPSLEIWVCTSVMDEPTGEESCGVSYNMFYIVPSLPEGAACSAVCGDASGAVGTTVMRADPVNTATGAFTEAFTDAQVPAPGVPLMVGRVYSSDNTVTGALGKGWQLPWETRLQFDSGGDAVLIGEGGTRHTYAKESDGSFTTPREARSTLAADGDGYKVTTADHTEYSYNASGRLTAWKDRTGRGLSLSYTGTQPTEITDTAGRTAKLTYSGDLLDKVTLADGRVVDYGFTEGRLTSVTGLDGNTESYGYDAAGLLDSVTDARAKTVVTNAYDSQGRVTSQTDALGDTTKFAYTQNGPFDQVDITAPDGGVWTDVYYDNVLFTQLDPFGNGSTYRYDQFFNRTSAVDAEYRKTTWTFDSAGRLKRRANSASSEEWTYDADGNVASHEGGEYDETLFGYNADNQLTSVTDPLGKQWAVQYDSATGLPQTVTTPRGKATRYGYDSVGNLTSLTSAEGRKTTYTYYLSGQVKTVTDPRGNVEGADPAKYTTRYTYDDANRVTSVTDPRGNTTAYAYDKTGNLRQVTDAKSRTTVYDYDDAGRLTTVTDPAGKTTLVGYDKAGRALSVTDRTGATTTYTYDKAGNQTALVTPRGNAEGATETDYTWTIGYDKAGNRKTVTDPLGKTTAFTWDADNRPLEVTDPLNHTRRATYNDNGNLTKLYDGLNQITVQLAYDDGNRLISSGPRSDELTTYEYDDDGNLTAQVTPEGERTSYGYDGDGLRTSMVDARGNVTGADPAEYTWTFGYDQAGHPTTVTDPLGNKQSAGYDTAGNVTSITDARDKATLYEYDELNRPVKVTAPDGGITNLGYNTAGYLTSRTDANTHTTTYGRDAEGRLTALTNPLAETVTYDYDPDGNRHQVTNARGQTITTTFDARNLPTAVAYSDGTPGVSVTYDDASRPTGVTDATGTRTLTYNDDNQVESITAPGASKPFRYLYNTDGTLKYRYDPQGDDIAYTYDKNNRVKTQRFDYGGTVTYTYDAAGHLTGAALPTTTARSETRTFDAAGRLATATTPAGTRTYSYDANGRVTADQPDTGYPTRYAYDDTGRLTRTCTDSSNTSCLTGTSGTTHDYDQVGNLTESVTNGTTTTYDYDAADQLQQTVTGTATTAYGYDADGNQTTDGADTYTYDPVGRIKTATIGSDTYGFLYDADGNRTVTTTNGATARTTYWDVNNTLPQIASETDASGTVLGQYQYDPAGLPQSMQVDGSDYFLTHTRQGSTDGVYDSTGTQTQSYSYTPWGQTTATGDGQASPFTYTGQYADPVLPGRMLLRARSYDTTQQRFTSVDPLLAAADNPNQSPYNYADNDPTNLADPTGQCPMCIGAVIGGLIGGTAYAFTHEGDWNWGDFAAATGQGAVVGAIGGFLAPAGTALATQLGLQGGRALAVATVTDAAIGMGLTWAINTAQCQPTTPTDLIVGALTGGLGNFVKPAWGALRGIRLFPAKVKVYAGNPPISLFRSPLKGNRATEARGLNAGNHPSYQSSDGRIHEGTAYLGESDLVAERYAAQGIYENGYHEFVMKPGFLKEFHPDRYRRTHDNRPGQFQWIIPTSEIPRFNEQIDDVIWWNYQPGIGAWTDDGRLR